MAQCTVASNQGHQCLKNLPTAVTFTRYTTVTAIDIYVHVKSDKPPGCRAELEDDLNKAEKQTYI